MCIQYWNLWGKPFAFPIVIKKECIMHVSGLLLIFRLWWLLVFCVYKEVYLQFLYVCPFNYTAVIGKIANQVHATNNETVNPNPSYWSTYVVHNYYYCVNKLYSWFLVCRFMFCWYTVLCKKTGSYKIHITAYMYKKRLLMYYTKRNYSQAICIPCAYFKVYINKLIKRQSFAKT